MKPLSVQTINNISPYELRQETPSFLQMQGILKGEGNEATDRQMLDEYLQEKYNV